MAGTGAASASGFRQLLKRFRTERTLTPEDLADRAGVSPGYVSIVERGRRTPPPALAVRERSIRTGTGQELRRDLRACAWLVRLLPELADTPIEPLPDWTLGPEQERRLMVEAIIRFLTNIGGPRGTLLLLDDL